MCNIILVHKIQYSSKVIIEIICYDTFSKSKSISFCCLFCNHFIAHDSLLLYNFNFFKYVFRILINLTKDIKHKNIKQLDKRRRKRRRHKIIMTNFPISRFLFTFKGIMTERCADIKADRNKNVPISFS